VLPILLESEHEAPIRELTVGHDYFGRFALRKGDWKLVTFDTGQDEDYLRRYPVAAPQLFHTSQDIGETRDLASKHPDMVRDLMRLLEKCRAGGRSSD
jgi:hypothetical protein